MPESFNVLVRELKGLGLNVDLMGSVSETKEVKTEEKEKKEPAPKDVKKKEVKSKK